MSESEWIMREWNSRDVDAARSSNAGFIANKVNIATNRVLSLGWLPERDLEIVLLPGWLPERDLEIPVATNEAIPDSAIKKIGCWYFLF